MSAEDREKHLFYALNSGGLYHSFLERLKPRVQRIVRKRFGRKAFFARCECVYVENRFSSSFFGSSSRAFFYGPAFLLKPFQSEAARTLCSHAVLGCELIWKNKSDM